MYIEDLKKELYSHFSDLRFEEKDHKYYVNNRPLSKSVSGIAKQFFKPFDIYNISKAVAKKRNITQEEVLQEWETKKERGCSLGTEVHRFGELYAYDRSLKPQNKYEEAIACFWKDTPKHIVPLITEFYMYHKELMYGGTADLILLNTKTNSLIIGDYKTDKDLFSSYKNQTLLGPFSHLEDNGFNKYQIKMSFYQILFEQTGYKISDRKLIWLRPDGSYFMYNTADLTEFIKNTTLVI